MTGVERVSVTAWLLSRLMLSVSACSFLKASARRRKKPLRVFITSTVVFFATWVLGALECTTTESSPLLRLFIFSCR
ncbi:Uncharacterised protein [Segatella copri]|nr:Uncharacterised protein [Segatella copri]